MNIAKYFWDLKDESLKQTEKILKNSNHPQFNKRMVTYLSRCDSPKELFMIAGKERFLGFWPGIRSYWIKHVRRSDARDWWETIYEQLSEKYHGKKSTTKGSKAAFFIKTGKTIKEKRIAMGLTQKQLALQLAMKQPDVSKIEEGKKNITLFTLLRICKILAIKTIHIE